MRDLPATQLMEKGKRKQGTGKDHFGNFFLFPVRFSLSTAFVLLHKMRSHFLGVYAYLFFMTEVER